MTRPRDRDPAAIGALSLVLIVLVSLGGFFFEDLPLIGGSTTYRAHFTEAAGLKAENQVRVAGVKVGSVSEVTLEDDHVLVEFDVDDTWLGDRSTAAIEIKTVLGEKYLSLDPRGDTEQDPSQAIPRDRTTTPFDISTAVDQLAGTVAELDTAMLAKSLETISETFRDSPTHVRGALDGLSSLAKTISSRNDQLATLLNNTGRVSAVLADRDEHVRKLIADGNLLLGELRNRREAIGSLFVGIQHLSTELRGLVADNQRQLTPALEHLDNVAAILQRNQDNLGRGLAMMAPFVRVFNNTVGNGRWFDSYICGLLPPRAELGAVAINPDGCTPPITDSATRGGGR